MKVAVIGAGIAGITCAYELSADGHEVSIFERRGSVAAEASFANAGTIAPGQALPWTRPRFGLGWRLKQWKAARDPAWEQRAERLLHLAVYSHTRLQTLRRALQLDYEHADGQLVLLRDKAEREAIAPGLELLARLGLVTRELDAEGVRAAEPGLNAETPLLGGIKLPLAEVGNCRQFAHLLRLEAQKLGAKFRFHTTVRSVAAGGQVTHEYTPHEDATGAASRLPDAGDTVPQATGLQTDRFDAVVVCAALQTDALLGRKIGLQAVVSHSITAPLRQLEAHPDLGPRGGLTDQRLGVSLSRIGQRVRASGPNDTALHKALHDWFPGATLAAQSQRWSGAHAQLADNLPLIGASGLDRVWLNAAHGDAGWTLACGAARALAESVAGLQPEVNITGLGIDRFG
jgi:D-amino-acid dehydrogenase